MQPSQIEWLLEELCTEHGICLSGATRERILTQSLPSSADFAVAVFRAHGLEPREHRQLYQTVLAKVSRAYAAQSRAV